MAGTRRSARVANSSSAPVYNEEILEGKIPRSGSGRKRKEQSGSSPAAKRGKKGPEEKQQSLEESLDQSKPAPSRGEDAQDAELAAVIEKSKREAEPSKDTESTDAPALPAEIEKHAPAETAPTETAPTEVPTQPNDLSEAPVEVDGGKNQPSADNGAPEEVKASEAETKTEINGTRPSETKEEQLTSTAPNGNTAVQAHAPDHDTPASIKEKGILYFMFRARVGIDEPQDVNDIARSFLVMRPLPHDAKLGDGPIGDAGNCRLLALPKKVLPASGKDRFLAFVEKSKVSFKELKHVFSASDYETQTLGTRHTPAMTPVGEAIYAITTTGRESHLAYILTVPDQLREVQRDIGLKERGSFIISTKNPQAPSPANASIGKSPDYPQDIIDSFRSLRWMPSEPRHLDYANAQFLMIGESSGLDKATEAQPEDVKNDKDTPLQEMEKLEGEDEIRIKHLKGDDAIFADLEDHLKPQRK